MTPATAYARYSPRPNPEESDSIEVQLARCKAYCQAHGYELRSTHADEELSGGRADNRPGLQAAVAAACKTRGVLVVYSLSRLARNTRDALAILDRLRAAKADLASLSESIDTRGPMGEFFFTVMSAFYAMERAVIRQRTSDAMRQHQANGRRMTRADCCPYGWRADPANLDRLIADPAEQMAVALIHTERAAGRSLREIARRLDLAGVPCRGLRWSASTIRAILARRDTTVRA